MTKCVVHQSGVVEFPNAFTVDPDAVAQWMELRRTCEPDDYTVNDDGNFVNRGGYVFTPEQYQSSPSRFLNLEPEGEDTTFLESILDVMYKCVLEYIYIFPTVAQSIWWRTDGQVASYKDGQGMGPHHDRAIEYIPGDIPASEAPIHNERTGSIVLQKAEEGGQLLFPINKTIINGEAGTVILYPSNYIGSHAVAPVTRGERLSYLEFYGQGTPGGYEGNAPAQQSWFSALLDPETGQRPMGGQSGHERGEIAGDPPPAES